MFSPGDLRHRVTVQRANETLGSLGNPVSTWVALYERIPALVEELSGRELWNAQQIQADLSISVKTWWVDGIKSKMRLIWHDRDGDRTLNIEVPPRNPDGRKRGMQLLCKEAA